MGHVFGDVAFVLLSHSVITVSEEKKVDVRVGAVVCDLVGLYSCCVVWSFCISLGLMQHWFAIDWVFLWLCGAI